MQNWKHWTALAGYGKCKMKNAKKKLEKSSWQKVVGCDKVNKLSLESDWWNYKSETEKIKKLLTNDKRCDNLSKLSLETTTKTKNIDN